MNKITISLLTLSLFFGTSLFAQSDWCATDEMLEEQFKNNPEAERQFWKEAAFTPEQLAAGEKANNKIIIPLVVHVIHYQGDGNISKAQIMSGIQQLNEDFSKQNSDTSTVRSQFSGLIGNANIEFRLAKLDPNGQCTEGITRHSDLTTYSPDRRNAPKNVIQWDPYSYLNVWIVNSINSGAGGGVIGGFAQFPGSGSPSTYGLVVRNDEWGTIGTASTSSFGGRAVTHEIGHCLNLYHPFQGACGSSCTNSGDYVCDTPPQSGSHNNTCNFNTNSCTNDAVGGNSANPNPYTSNVPDQLENFMGYGIGCQVMFTEGQVSRMRAAINQYALLDSLRTPYNLAQTGTNDNYSAAPCLPHIEVAALKKFACIGDSVTFKENSWGGVIQSYNWSFPGGAPSTSSAAEPKVSYDSAGTYDVILRVSNSRGTDSLVLEDYVIVSPDTGYSAATYIETFEDNAKFNKDWTILKTSPNPNWELFEYVGSGASSQSAWINNFYSKYAGDKDALVSPPIDLSKLSNPTINFDVSFKRKKSNNNDKLKIFISDDCGVSWSNLISASPSFFALNGTQTSNFIPTNNNHWKTINLPSSAIPSSYQNKSNVRFKIELVTGGGNNLYIDNFSLNSTLTGIKDHQQVVSNFNVFPNPAQDYVTIKVDVEAGAGQTKVYLTDILGKRVANIYEGQMDQSVYTFKHDLSSYESGIYFITVQSSKGRSTQKLIVK